MRGRDGGRGEAGRDIGVWSVAIKSNLSCDKVLGQQTRTARGRRGRTRSPISVPAQIWIAPLGLVAWTDQPRSSPQGRARGRPEGVSSARRRTGVRQAEGPGESK